MDELLKALTNFEVVDLSHTIERGMPRWPTHPQVIVDPCCTFEHDGFYNQCLVMGEHTGTHMDAPAHTVPSQPERTVDTLPPDCVCGSAVVYDMRGLGLEAGDRLSAEDILSYEQRMGAAVGRGEIALFNFGWERHWRTDGGWQYYAKNEPGLSEEAVKLIAERGVRAVGFDTISSDMPIKEGVEYPSTGHYEHWLPRGILLVEELKNLTLLPARCYFIAIPLKIKNGSGSPVRPMALVPKRKETPGNTSE